MVCTMTEQWPEVNGWERDVDIADTVLRRFVHHLAALDATITLAACGRAVTSEDVALTDLGRPGGLRNGAVLTRPPSDWDDVLDRIERFAAEGCGPFRLCSVWPTPDLRGRGWRCGGHPALMLRPLPFGPGPVTETRGPDLRAVASPSELAAWERAAVLSTGLVELAPLPAGSSASPALLDDERVGFFVALEADRTAAAALAFVSHGLGSIAVLSSGDTDRRTVWSAAARVGLAARPDSWFAAVVDDPDRPAALGFFPLLRSALWTLDRP
jgi:hypothetical protein